MDGQIVNISKTTNRIVEVEGYGPYKPVPPPKPLPQQPTQNQQQQQQQQPISLTPPPYRMPPYPLYNEPSIPGAAAGLETPIAASSPATTQGLHTHSSKFPIEREVILSSTDKNSKIPILHDYKKRTKATIAPDAPPKQMAAWTQGQMQNHQILPDETHSGLIQTIQQTGDVNGPVYRATYHPAQEYYNGQPSTGAVPRSSWYGGGDPNKPAPRPINEEFNNSQTVVQIEGKESGQKEQNKNSKSMTKTYHTIKDIISSKFKSNKDSNEDKPEEPGLNNVTEELRKSQGNLVEEEKKAQGDRNVAMQQHQYSQHMIQQHLLAQQAQQQYQVNQQMKTQQQYTQQLSQSRSQEMLSTRQDEAMYYQGNYNGTPQRNSRFPQNREQQNYQMQGQMQYMNGKEVAAKDERRQPIALERRSAQQIERDNQRQKSFEARRTASQPQLAYDDEVKTEIQDHRPQPQAASSTPSRRGSHGNIMEANRKQEQEKDSDDGGFLKRHGSKERRLDGGQKLDDGSSNGDSKVTDALQGAPRKKLEGEIGKIEGVYNVGHRSKPNEEDAMRITKKNNPSSGTSSDYDKAGGQSSSNVDSGRGSAAYSSGRRPGGLDLMGDTENSSHGNNPNFRDHHGSNHDPEWVDIVENELRHILEPRLHELSLQGNGGMANSTMSESISSMTPPLPPLSPGDQSSPNMTPRNSTRYKHSSLPYGSKPDYDGYKSKNHSREMMNSSRWNANSSNKHRSGKKIDHNAILRSKQIFGLDTTDLTSTTTRSLDLESMLDGQSDSEGDISTTDARTIRKQLEGLESMYSEVLKLLGVKKQTGRYQPSDPRFSKRRYGSMSSLPSSSVSSRPIRDKRRASEDRKKVRDIRGINKRFQRLESHVVTLARSVAHLSSEMRTQHLMIQEMENIRGEIAALRTQTNMLNVRSQSTSRAVSSAKELPTLANPTRVKKLTKFFGDEPPLLRLFLRKLGYEKYANLFENERIGMVELPYLSEERLQKMGLPLGPRLRIMQEAQISVCKDNTLCIV
ncbi:uncharacterized protein LOC109595245 isoform X3 [Aethina tumida]|uniref:uncharacterized protein LOC109595245 isoform X3 n=1 Tax=Aethina tumida TaxID=116153 RepID=UPI00214844F2|nr:uncharacterized protein LOC109595245 isoform X3 [Aethina tumida]